MFTNGFIGTFPMETSNSALWRFKIRSMVIRVYCITGCSLMAKRLGLIPSLRLLWTRTASLTELGRECWDAVGKWEFG
jgi:hypothetical protein